MSKVIETFDINKPKLIHSLRRDEQTRFKKRIRNRYLTTCRDYVLKGYWIDKDDKIKRVRLKTRTYKRIKAQKLRAINKRDLNNVDLADATVNTRAEHKKKPGNILWEIW